MERAVQVGLYAFGMDVAVLSRGGGVPGGGAVEVFAFVAEVVFAAGGKGLAVDAQAQAVAQLPLIEGREAQQVAGPVFQASLPVLALPRGEMWPTGVDVDRLGRGEVAGGLEDGTLLSVVEGYLVDVL